MEIEKKYLVKKLPENLETYPFNQLEQCYLCVDPVVRIRRIYSDLQIKAGSGSKPG
mgnify:CR=1 FL=1